MKLSTRVIHMCSKPVGLAQDYAPYLTRSIASTLAGEPLRRVARRRSLVLWGVLCVMGMTPAAHAKEQTPSADVLRIYAHVKLVNYKEFQCFNAIINKESRWSVSARNGSHYGLGQMRSKHYGKLDGLSQIDKTIGYIRLRYGTMCKAWAFHQQRNYY